MSALSLTSVTGTSTEKKLEDATLKYEAERSKNGAIVFDILINPKNIHFHNLNQIFRNFAKKVRNNSGGAYENADTISKRN